MYKLSSQKVGPSDDKASSVVMKKWNYIGYVRAHTHDVRALTVAVPICREGLSMRDLTLILFLFVIYLLFSFMHTHSRCMYVHG